MARGKRKQTLEEKLFFKIGDVAELTELRPYVLRYWETEFSFLKPKKTPKGQRVYHKKDIEIILKIKDLLYTRGFTIAGARRVLQDELGKKKGRRKGKSSGKSAVLAEIKKELRDILTLLDHGA